MHVGVELWVKQKGMYVSLGLGVERVGGGNRVGVVSWCFQPCRPQWVISGLKYKVWVRGWNRTMHETGRRRGRGTRLTNGTGEGKFGKRLMISDR